MLCNASDRASNKRGRDSPVPSPIHSSCALLISFRENCRLTNVLARSMETRGDIITSKQCPKTSSRQINRSSDRPRAHPRSPVTAAANSISERATRVSLNVATPFQKREREQNDRRREQSKNTKTRRRFILFVSTLLARYVVAGLSILFIPRFREMSGQFARPAQFWVLSRKLDQSVMSDIVRHYSLLPSAMFSLFYPSSANGPLPKQMHDADILAFVPRLGWDKRMTHPIPLPSRPPGRPSLPPATEWSIQSHRRPR